VAACPYVAEAVAAVIPPGFPVARRRLVGCVGLNRPSAAEGTAVGVGVQRFLEGAAPPR
jgi:hypothetical protein